MESWTNRKREGRKVGARRRRKRRRRGFRLGVTCVKAIRPPHSILTDRPGEGSANTPETHTSLHHSPLCRYHTFSRPSLSLSLSLSPPLSYSPSPPSFFRHLLPNTLSTFIKYFLFFHPQLSFSVCIPPLVFLCEFSEL